jgi:hypothetical protein
MFNLELKRIKKLHITIFDVLVVSLILCVVGVFLYLRFTKNNEWINVRMVIANDDWSWEGQAPQWWYVDDLESGQIAYSSFNEKIAEITNVESFDIGGYRRRAFVDLKLKGAYDKGKKIYIYNFQPLQIGKPLDLTFGKNNVHGLITYIDKNQIGYKDRKVEVKIYTVKPWVADSLVQGLETKDSLGRTLATVDSVNITVASYYEYSDIRGSKILISDPNLRDVTLRLTIKTFMSNNTEYFIDRAAIKIGEKIWFQFPQTVIRDAEITKILE